MLHSTDDVFGCTETCDTDDEVYIVVIQDVKPCIICSHLCKLRKANMQVVASNLTKIVRDCHTYYWPFLLHKQDMWVIFCSKQKCMNCKKITNLRYGAFFSE